MSELSIAEKFQPFLEKKKRFKVAIGGRGSGKSVTFADLLLLRAHVEGVKVGCFREFMNSMDDSVYSLLCEEVSRLEFPCFRITNTSLINSNGAEFKFKGMSRNTESIKSMHGFDIFFIEEAQTISFESLKVITPTLRKENSEIWLAGNPRSRADPFSQRFIVPYEKELLSKGYYEDELHFISIVNYDDNPFFPDVLEKERKHAEQTLSKALYEHIWLGRFYDEIENTIIKTEWFDAAIDAHKKLKFKPTGKIVAAHDPSDEGGDSKGFVIRHGSHVIDIQENTTDDVNDGLDWALELTLKHNASVFVWDCDGMGISLKRQVAEGLDETGVEAMQFKGSQSAEDYDQIYSKMDNDAFVSGDKTNGETFYNRRAQFYWRLRDRFFNTYRAVIKGEYVNPDDLISLDSSIELLDNLRSEVCRIPLKKSNNGKIQLLTKAEMAKKPYQLPSPNLADSLMMSMVKPSYTKAKFKKIKFEGW